MRNEDYLSRRIARPKPYSALRALLWADTLRRMEEEAERAKKLEEKQARARAKANRGEI